MKSEKKEYISKWKFVMWLPEIEIDWNFHFQHSYYPTWAKTKDEAIFESWQIGWLEIRRFFTLGKIHPGLSRISERGHCANCGAVTNFWDNPTHMYVCPNCTISDALKKRGSNG